MSDKVGEYDSEAKAGDGFFPRVGANSYSDQVWLNKRSDAHSKTLVPSDVSLTKTLPLRWDNDPAKWTKFLARVSAAVGYSITDPNEAMKVWADAVDYASSKWQSTRGGKAGKPYTPFEVLEKWKRDREHGVPSYGMTSSGAGGTGRETVKTVDEMSPGTAWGVIEDAVRSAMGRSATDKEMRRFISKAHDIASRNPNIESTTTSVDASGKNTSTSRRVKQGASQGDYQLAAQNMAATPEAGAFQAASTYFGALQQALGSTANLANPAGT